MKKILAGLILAVLVVLAWGATLPGKTALARKAAVNLPPQAVWEVVADAPGYATWHRGADKWPKLTKSEWAAGSPKGGRQSTRQCTYDNGDVCSQATIAWEPGKRYSWAVDFAASKLSWRLDSLKEEVLLEPSGKTGTDMTWSTEYYVHSPVMKIMSRFMIRPNVEVALARALEGLKAEAELRAVAKAKRPGRSRKA